jgi:hypothetical protein
LIGFKAISGGYTDYYTIYGFDHLVGETIRVKGDGEYIGDYLVSAGGTITLTGYYDLIEGGLAYTARAIPVPPEFLLPTGATRGKPKRWVKCGVDVVDAVDITINGVSKTLGTYASPFTGYHEIVDLGWDVRNSPTIEHSDPYGLTVLGLVGNIEISEW